MSRSVATIRGTLSHGGTFRRPVAPPRPPVLALITAIVVVGWIIAILTTHFVRFVIFTPQAKTGFDVTLSLLSLFVALVLILFPDEADRDRLCWVALGFSVLGVGGLVFGYLVPLLEADDDLGRAMYCSLAVRTAALLAMAIGMAPARPPAPTRRNLLIAFAVFAALGLLALLVAGGLPTLVHVTDLEAVADESDATLEGLTGWHWALSMAPLALAVVTAIGVVRHAVQLAGREWLVVAAVLMAGSQLHTMFWPSAYSPVLTTASILRLAFTLVVALGAVYALRRVAVERTAVLAAERELGKRLAELAVLRADFTAMVAHELASPAAALQAYAAMLATGALDKEAQIGTATAIRIEANLIRTLIEDVRSAASAERDDFELRIESTPLAPLLMDAAAFARSLPGDHPVQLEAGAEERVPADRERIAQVLRNLLGNAAKHTPPGTPITLRAVRRGDTIRIEVIDRGAGIHPDDLDRIFEKFGRGRDALGERVPGVGLGLYLSRRIVQLHGGELGVEQTDGGGSTFWFELAIAG